jgi:hypothetical protein
MEEMHAEDPVHESPAQRPQAGAGLTPAQLKAAAKVVKAHLAQETRRLRRMEPPSEPRERAE